MNGGQILGNRLRFTRSALELQAGVVTAGHVCLQRNYSTHAGRSSLISVANAGEPVSLVRSSPGAVNRCADKTLVLRPFDRAKSGRTFAPSAASLARHLVASMASPASLREPRKLPESPIGNRQNRHSLTSGNRTVCEIPPTDGQARCWHFDPHPRSKLHHLGGDAWFAPGSCRPRSIAASGFPERSTHAESANHKHQTLHLRLSDEHPC